MWSEMFHISQNIYRFLFIGNVGPSRVKAEFKKKRSKKEYPYKTWFNWIF